MGLPVAGTGGWKKTPAGSIPEPTLLATKKAEEKQEWLVVDRTKGKPQATGSQSPEGPNDKETNSPSPKGEAPASYASRLHELSKKFDPGYEMFNKIKELERQLKTKK